MKDKLDAILRKDAAIDLDDGGFSARVVQALPPRRSPARSWWTPALLVVAAALGGFLAAALLPAGSALIQGYIDLAQNRGLTSSAVTALGMALALVVCSVVLAADTD